MMEYKQVKDVIKLDIYNEELKDTGNTLIGYFEVDIINNELVNIELFPRYRNNGYGKEILEYILNNYTIDRLHFCKDERTLNFFVNNGFTVEDETDYEIYMVKK